MEKVILGQYHTSPGVWFEACLFFYSTLRIPKSTEYFCYLHYVMFKVETLK